MFGRTTNSSSRTTMPGLGVRRRPMRCWHAAATHGERREHHHSTGTDSARAGGSVGVAGQGIGTRAVFRRVAGVRHDADHAGGGDGGPDRRLVDNGGADAGASQPGYGSTLSPVGRARAFIPGIFAMLDAVWASPPDLLRADRD